MFVLLAALCFAAGAAVVLFQSSWKNHVFWILAGVAFYIAANVDFDSLTI